MKKLMEESYSYILYEKDEELILSVLCGTVAMFDRTIVLNAEERSAFEKNGKEYIDSLAARIRFSPSSFDERHIDI